MTVVSAIGRRGNGRVAVAVVVAGLLLAVGGARAAELSKYQEEKQLEAGKTRQLTPYLDRWKTAEYDTPFRDPSDRSMYQGDLPFYGDWLFLNLEAVLDGFYKHRRNADFTKHPVNGNQVNEPPQTFFRDNDFRRLIGLFGFEMRNADDVFKPATWRLRVLGGAEVDEDFNAKDDGDDHDVTIIEAFAEHKVFDLGELDLAFIRLGIEPFKSEFHGLLFFDNTLSARLFGEYAKNKYRYNFAVLRPINKDAHSNFSNVIDDDEPQGNSDGLQDRYIGIASLAIADVTPGWNGEFSFHYDHNRDDSGAKPFDRDAYYVGTTFNGALGPINFNPAAYVVFGKDRINAVDALGNVVVNGRETDILAGLALLDAAYTLPAADYITLRGGYLFQSGDKNPGNDDQNGFAAPFENIALFGAGASYWTAEAIFFNKFGQTNGASQLVKTNGVMTDPFSFDAPGLHLFNLGALVKLTQRLDSAINVNYMMFAEPDNFTQQVGQQVGQQVDRQLGLDVNAFVEWRPVLLKSFFIDLSGSGFFPGSGFEDAVGDDSILYTFVANARFVY